MVLLTPRDKVLHHSPVLGLITLAETSNHSRVIRKLLKVAGLCVVVEVCGVEGEEEGRQDRPLTDTVLSCRDKGEKNMALTV